MADVSSDIKDWSITASSNLPADATSIGAGLADNFQQIQATVRAAFSHKGADIASATSTNLGAITGAYHDITGVTTIVDFGTVSAGVRKILQFDGAVLLTYDATKLILPGNVNITTAAGDHCEVMSLGSGNWICLWYTRDATGLAAIYDTSALTANRTITFADRALTVGGLIETPVTASTTSVDFTSITAGVRRITLMFSDVSTSSGSEILIQIGDTGGLEATGYLAVGVRLTPTVTNTINTTGFGILLASGSDLISGAVTLDLLDASTFTWTANGTFADGNPAVGNAWLVSGYKSLSATLDRVSINGVTFDGGKINISYE